VLPAAFAALGVWVGSWGAALPATQVATGASDGAVGLALLAGALAGLPVMLLAGRLADRAGPGVVRFALAGFGLAVVLPGLARSVPALALALVAASAFAAMLDVTMNAAGSVREAVTGRRLMNKLHGFYSLGVVGGAIVTGVGRGSGLSHTVLLGASGALALVAATLPGLPARPAPAPRERAPRRAFRPALLVLGGLSALCFLMESSLETWSALHVERTLGGPPALAGLGPAAFAALMAAGRLGAHRMAGGVPDAGLVALAGLTGGAGIALAAAAPGIEPALLGFGLAGIGLSVAVPTLFGAAGRLGGEEGRGAALATVTSVSYLGLVLGPPLMGLVAGASGLRAAFAAVAALGLVLALGAPAVRRVPG
jgi:MFS family permease